MPTSSRTIVERFLRGEFDVLSPEAEIWVGAKIPLEPDETSRGGPVKRAHLVAMMTKLNDGARSPFRITPTGWTVDGERVAVEAEGRAELADGTVYTNRYHLLFRVEGERIVEMREYLDSRRVADVFGR